MQSEEGKRTVARAGEKRKRNPHWVAKMGTAENAPSRASEVYSRFLLPGYMGRRPMVGRNCAVNSVNCMGEESWAAVCVFPVDKSEMSGCFRVEDKQYPSNQYAFVRRNSGP